MRHNLVELGGPDVRYVCRWSQERGKSIVGGNPLPIQQNAIVNTVLCICEILLFVVALISIYIHTVCIPLCILFISYTVSSPPPSAV